MVIIWTEPAIEDLHNIFSYIALESRFYAQKVVDEIIEKAESVIPFPEKGRMVPEMQDENVREVFVYSYRIVYELVADTVQINTIIHGLRDFEKTFSREEQDINHTPLKTFSQELFQLNQSHPTEHRAIPIAGLAS